MFSIGIRMKFNLLTETVKDETMNTVCGVASAVLPLFIRDTLSHMIPWLIATFAVILCDLVFGIRKSMMMKEKIRFSMAARRTMGKTVTYFAFVCTVCAVEVASGESYGIDKWSCLVVCFVEFSSILSNILKPKGYSLNLKELVALLIGKVSNIDKKDIENIIDEEKK
jgi:hypothetical protein